MREVGDHKSVTAAVLAMDAAGMSKREIGAVIGKDRDDVATIKAHGRKLFVASIATTRSKRSPRSQRPTE